MRIALVCPAEAGHLLPMGSLGLELKRRGHEVTFISPEAASPAAERLGIPLYSPAHDAYRESWLQPVCLALLLTGHGREGGLALWFQRYAHWCLTALPGALSRIAAEGVILDQTLPAGAASVEHAGLPFVTLCPAIPWNSEPALPPPQTGWRYDPGLRGRLRNRLGYAGWDLFFGPVLRMIARARCNWGMTPQRGLEAGYSSLAQISQLCPALDYPREALPDVFHYIGSLTKDRPTDVEPPFPWERLDGRPLIYASLGTVADHGNESVYPRLIAACESLEAQLVLGLGRWSRESRGSAPPALVHGPSTLVVDFAPQRSLVARAAVVVSHAGLNSIMETLGQGVPVVALPRGADQHAITARVVRAGAGLAGSFRRSSSGEIRELVRRVLSGPGFRREAQVLRGALEAAGGAPRAAEIAEIALATRRPVRAGARSTPANEPVPAP